MFGREVACSSRKQTVRNTCGDCEGNISAASLPSGACSLCYNLYPVQITDYCAVIHTDP